MSRTIQRVGRGDRRHLRQGAIAVLSVLIVGALLAVVAGGWVLWQRRSARAEDAAIAALKSSLGSGTGTAEEHHALGLALLQRSVAKKGDSGSDRAQLGEEGIAQLEIAAERDAASLVYGNDLRVWSTRLGRYDQGIRFFERLAREREDAPEPHLQLALAYVDKMPDHMMGIVGQGQLSKRSIAQLTRLLASTGAEASPVMSPTTQWAALYALGMNHLYWPKMLRHAPAAEDAFRRCLAHQKTMPAPREGTAFHVLPYLGLGDALVKQGRHDEARAVYKEAALVLPSDVRVRERLAAGDDAALTGLVDRERGLGIVIDTDLSILWGRSP